MKKRKNETVVLRHKERENIVMKKAVKIIGILILIFAVMFAGLFVYLTVTEYCPKEKERLFANGSLSGKSLKRQKMIKVLTWNVGYGALGERADFFLDGGKHVKSASKSEVESNINGIAEYLNKADPDIFLLQELDQKATRSYYINEVEVISNLVKGYRSTFAYNFKVGWIPYPLPMIGQVNAGIGTYSKFPIKRADRLRLPTPFSWPVRTVNLKRCLAVHRFAVKDTKRELVVVNLHLEAYDKGEGKRKQTELLRKFFEIEVKKGNYVIAGGDFNQSFSNINRKQYSAQEGLWKPGVINIKEFRSDIRFCMDTTCPTCRSLDKPLYGSEQKTFQFYMIDGFMVSKNITVVSCRTQNLKFVHSDHNPVELKIKLK